MPFSSETIAQFAAALAKAQSELVNPAKTLTAVMDRWGTGNAGPSYRYAPLSAGLEIVRKTLCKHELAVIQTTEVDHERGFLMSSVGRPRPSVPILDRVRRIERSRVHQRSLSQRRGGVNDGTRIFRMAIGRRPHRRSKTPCAISPASSPQTTSSAGRSPSCQRAASSTTRSALSSIRRSALAPRRLAPIPNSSSRSLLNPWPRVLNRAHRHQVEERAMRRKVPLPRCERRSLPRRLRAEIMLRQEGRCADCGTRLILGFFVFDHRPPLALREEKADANEPERLAAICWTCNQQNPPAISRRLPRRSASPRITRISSSGSALKCQGDAPLHESNGESFRRHLSSHHRPRKLIPNRIPRAGARVFSRLRARVHAEGLIAFPSSPRSEPDAAGDRVS
jgi:5-methylcytosine-specific restriction endonuclease McrA